MKLRFRKNSLRLRVNQAEVRSLASGAVLQEEVNFPGNIPFIYTLQSSLGDPPQATFDGRTISVVAPRELVHHWAEGEEIGLYFDLPGEKSTLTVAIEKDLDCMDAPPGERDPEAFPRTREKVC